MIKFTEIQKMQIWGVVAILDHLSYCKLKIPVDIC